MFHFFLVSSPPSREIDLTPLVYVFHVADVEPTVTQRRKRSWTNMRKPPFAYPPLHYNECQRK